MLPGGGPAGHARLILAGAGRRPPAGSITYRLPPVARVKEPAALHAILEDAKPHLLYEMFGVIHDAFGLAAGPGGGPSGFGGMLAAVSARRRPRPVGMAGVRHGGRPDTERPPTPRAGAPHGPASRDCGFCWGPDF